jgi:hypothetical protein
MPLPRLTDWVKGNVLTHEHLQEPNDAIRDLYRQHDPSTPFVPASARPDIRLALLLGRVTNAGPAAEADFSTELYWVRIHGIAPTNTQTEQITLDPRFELPADPDDDEEPAVPLIVPATNASELATHTHNLAVDTPVMLLPFYDAQDEPTLHYLIISVDAAIPRPEVAGQLFVGVANGVYGWSLAPLVEFP